MDIVLTLIGLLALFFGADLLVKGAARLAASAGIPPLVIGLTLVAFATSSPELLVSVTAALAGSGDLSLGNVIGSNIANVGLILGLTGFFFPIAVHSQVIRRELPVMLAASFVTYVLALDGRLALWDGVLLLFLLVLFNVFSYVLALRGTAEGDSAAAEFESYEELEKILPATSISRPREFGRVILGTAILIVGAQAVVTGATGIARAFGISEMVIGITLVAFGTSLPELATSLVSAMRDEDDISIGNIVGSNIYNLLAVLGATAAVRSIPITGTVLRYEFPIMLAFSIVLWPLSFGGLLGRWRAALLLAAYTLFTVTLFLR